MEGKIKMKFKIGDKVKMRNTQTDFYESGIGVVLNNNFCDDYPIEVGWEEYHRQIYAVYELKLVKEKIINWKKRLR